MVVETGVVETLSDITEQKAVGVAAAVASSGLLELVFDQAWALQAGNLELLSEQVALLGTLLADAHHDLELVGRGAAVPARAHRGWNLDQDLR